MLAGKLAEHGATRVAREHRLDGRPVRRRAPDADHGDARHFSRPRCPGALREVEYRVDPVFGFEVPVSVPAVDDGASRPAVDLGRPADYDAKARELASMFRENFERRSPLTSTRQLPPPARRADDRPRASARGDSEDYAQVVSTLLRQFIAARIGASLNVETAFARDRPV